MEIKLMLTIIIGLCLIVVLLALRSKNNWINENLPFFLVLILYLTVLMGLFTEGDFYEDVNVETYNIGQVASASGIKVSDYFSRDARGNFYFVKVVGENNWITSKIPSDSYVFVTESPEIEQPVLKISKMGFKSNKWTFSIGYQKYIYRFELPLNKELTLAND